MEYTFGQRVAASAFSGLITGLFGLTTRHVRHGCRWHIRGPLDDEIKAGRPFLLATWHQDVLPLFHFLANRGRLEGRRPFWMLASRSFEGELTERILRPWGFRLLRGSSDRSGGRAALRGLRRVLNRGESAVIVSDGPRPPFGEMRLGPLWLARETGAPLYVARAWARPQVILARTPFRMAVPLPGAHFAFFSAGPIDVSGELAEARQRAQEALLGLCAETDAHLYLRRRVTGGVRLCEEGTV